MSGGLDSAAVAAVAELVDAGAARVAAARMLQTERYAAVGLPHIRTNSEAPASVLETVAR